MRNPAASAQYGCLETPDLRFFGRSEQLHLAFSGIWEFQTANSRLPGNNEEDFQAVLANVKKINEANKDNGLFVEELDEKVVKNATLYSKACLSPLAAFFGGVIA
jgi:ubiquitin-activating enzyme E1